MKGLINQDGGSSAETSNPSYSYTGAMIEGRGMPFDHGAHAIRLAGLAANQKATHNRVSEKSFQRLQKLTMCGNK